MSITTMPTKKRELHNHHFDSTIWNDINFRDDDIVISTYAKSGTTWVQQIVAQLIFNGQEGIEVAEMSPWVDLRVPPKEVQLEILESQTHRRFMKTHLPIDALVFSQKAKYIYIGRDGRDVLWSFYNHHSTANKDWYDVLNKTPGRVGPAMQPPNPSIIEYYHDWLNKDGYPIWPFWENIRSWWETRNLPNVLLVHFENLKKDMPSEIRRIAEFIDTPIDESNWESILKHCSFDYMKENASKSAPAGGIFWDGGAQSFIHKGTNGRWRDVLSKQDISQYKRRAEKELGSQCAQWLETGNITL
jgi:aryl sulfotransferase